MEQSALTGYRTALGNELLALWAVIEDGRGAVKIDRSYDRLERVLDSSARDQACRELERAGRMLKLVEAALKRIDLGTFGRCLICRQPIKGARLRALPWAEHCLPCEEAARRVA